MIGRRGLLLLPLAVAAMGGGAFAVMLHRMKQGSFDPREVGSPLVGKPAPEFSLPALGPGDGIARADLSAGHPLLVNFFASWCVPCRIEHPELMRLSQAGLPIWGIAYKDKAEAASAFLDRLGNPFARVANDQPGRAAIEWGVTGVPESFLIDGAGVVRWRYPGPLTPEIVAERLQPALQDIA